jgi:Ca2+-binding EF-hand superfamily protein
MDTREMKVNIFYVIFRTIANTKRHDIIDEEPLISDNDLSPKLSQVLNEIFDAFDKDNDGALSNQELGNFIFTTNGSHPPPQFLVQMAQRFGGTRRNWLTKEGFLVS